jgi:hypothetical protein
MNYKDLPAPSMEMIISGNQMNQPNFSAWWRTFITIYTYICIYIYTYIYIYIFLSILQIGMNQSAKFHRSGFRKTSMRISMGVTLGIESTCDAVACMGRVDFRHWKKNITCYRMNQAYWSVAASLPCGHYRLDKCRQNESGEHRWAFIACKKVETGFWHATPKSK